MKCEICNLGPSDGVTVFRQNPKGEKGIWRCGDHTTTAPPREVVEIAAAFDADEQRRVNRPPAAEEKP